MDDNQANVVLDFIDANWVAFEFLCEENGENSEDIRSELEKIAMGD